MNFIRGLKPFLLSLLAKGEQRDARTDGRIESPAPMWSRRPPVGRRQIVRAMYRYLRLRPRVRSECGFRGGTREPAGTNSAHTGMQRVEARRYRSSCSVLRAADLRFRE